MRVVKVKMNLVAAKGAPFILTMSSISSSASKSMPTETSVATSLSRRPLRRTALPVTEPSPVSLTSVLASSMPVANMVRPSVSGLPRGTGFMDQVRCNGTVNDAQRPGHDRRLVGSRISQDIQSRLATRVISNSNRMAHYVNHLSARVGNILSTRKLRSIRCFKPVLVLRYPRLSRTR